MAAGPFTVFGAAKEAVAKGLIDFDTDNFSVFLVTSAWTPSVNVDDTYSDLSANEVPNGSGYTTGGIDLAALAVSRASGVVTIDETTNPAWTSASFTCKYAVIAKRAGGSLTGTDLLVGYVDLDNGGGSITVTAGTLTITWNASGLFTIT